MTATSQQTYNMLFFTTLILALVTSTFALVPRAAKCVRGHSCPGRLIRDPIKLGKKGTLYVFYSPEKGGTNCAYLDNHMGRKVQMKVAIGGASLWHSGNNCGDEGKYIEYAGSVRIFGMAHACIWVIANIDGTEGESPSDGKWGCK